MTVSDHAGAVWRKSSHSGAGNDCVEIALAHSGARVRDSKNPEAGMLRFDATGWATFLTAAKG
ncbi:DUF397 domain-containing protein [Kibdelosporangium phytohabitans]|uniref:Transcriptional regulator n=1 Tax=Kibdelosporangium phytohabitans TaxID=860235 RepID=A0A0N9I4C8_9PSEU|nr:DUF397 domain-containing protein [Kibdelosporangium phytohabitans]ALG12764.1 transcriptional regulator [Kibdelosporangium phytohabitans]MBE1464440.1 hypothetical protein [Kibdelosporangium phytohabitans]